MIIQNLVKKTTFKNVDLSDRFFDSFREDYQEFDEWFIAKADSPCYVVGDDKLLAFLFIKIEEAGAEDYSEIIPKFEQKKRLKIGALKAISNGYETAEAFLKIILEQADFFEVEEIYFTIFDKNLEQEKFINKALGWGFVKHGVNTSKNGSELVYVKSLNKIH